MAKGTGRTIEVPADLNSGYVVPDGLTAADLRELAEAARGQAIAELDNTDVDRSERMARAQWLQAAMAALTEQAATVEAEEAEAERLEAELRAQLNPADDSDDQGDDSDGSDQGDDAPAAPEANTGDQGDDAPAADREPALTAGAGRAPSARQIAARRKTTPQVRPETERRAALLAAADLGGGIESGSVMNWGATGEAAEQRFQSLSNRGANGAASHLPIATVKLNPDAALVASVGRGDRTADVEPQIQAALATRDDDALLAAGWCAPSETLYDLPDMGATTDGLLDLPGITVNRGGVRWTLGFDFSALYSGVSYFTRTEAQMIAGGAPNNKPMTSIPCPQFTEDRLVVDGLFLTGDILSERGYPEAYAQFIRESLTGFEHYKNVKRLQTVAGASTLVDFTAAGVGTFGAAVLDTLGALELQAIDMRYRRRLGENTVMEVKLPTWAKGVLRQDLAKRQGLPDALTVTDAQIAAWFTVRNLAVSYVVGWQDAMAGDGTIGGATPPTAYPETVDALIYPAGTFVSAESDVIQLSAVYDSVLLQQNKYVALFIEQARLVLKRGFDSRLVRLPFVPTGLTAGTGTTTYPSI